MLHELKIDSVRPGHLPGVAKHFREFVRGTGGVKAFNGQLIKAWTSECGDLNKLYTLWSYADLDTRHKAEVARRQSGRYRDLLEHSRNSVTGVESVLLNPVSAVTPEAAGHTLFDFRMYEAHAPHGSEYAAHLMGVLPQRQRHSSNFCIWTALSGNLNRVLHMWPYKDYEHRAEVRALMAADPDWPDYLNRVYPLLARQRSSLLRALELD